MLCFLILFSIFLLCFVMDRTLSKVSPILTIFRKKICYNFVTETPQDMGSSSTTLSSMIVDDSTNNPNGFLFILEHSSFFIFILGLNYINIYKQG